MSPRAARAALACYAMGLALLTHWPKLTLPEQIPPRWRMDLLLHAALYAVLAWLCLRAAPRAWAARTRALVASVACIAYAVADETTQPMFNRTYDHTDLLADILGALAAVGLWLALRRPANGSSA